MKILHLVSGNLGGGAARGAYWLHKGLLDLGIDSRVLTTSTQTYGDPTVNSITTDKKGKLAELLRRQADFSLKNFYTERKKRVFSTGLFGFNFIKTREYQEADIVHLHWISGGFINIKHLRKIIKPLVWTMRDMWPMTGGCHYSIDCEGYQSGCGQCPQLGSRKSYDLSRFVFNRKKKYIPKRTELVGISDWLSNCARNSALFEDFDIRTIYNNVNTHDFFPIRISTARQILGLPGRQPIVLAGAQNLHDFYKGFDAYLQALNCLKSRPLLLFFGQLNSETISALDYNYVNLGYLHDTVSLRIAYSAADVFVAPSRMDAFGKTLAESMACGTPVVCFDATGPREIVDHLSDGYKARPFEPSDLSRGIEWLLADRERLNKMSENAYHKVRTKFDVPVIASKYSDLYQDLLKGSF